MAQVYNMTCPPSPQTINTCTGTFYDANGPATNYPNNQNCVYTFCSNSPGECLMMNFTNFNVSDYDIFGNVYDYLAVFDGNSVASPLLFYIWGGPFPTAFPVASSGTCLTFQFISDGSIRSPGWTALVNCQPCPIPTSPTQQDCNGAIPICQEQYYQPYSYSGNNGSNILPASSCIVQEENNSWYVFTAQTSGPLSFIISPNFTNDDYDFALYDISNNGCAGITTGASPEISCNWSANVATWAAQTGAFSGAPYNGTLNSQGAAGTSFNASPNVVAGNTYALVINNYSTSQGGYYLDLSPSTASLFDNIAPIMESVNTVACGANTITVNFSEPILCSTIQAADFTITGGPPTTVTSAIGVSCGGAGTYTQSVTLTVNPALTGGTFNVNLVGSITDLCGNASTGTLSFSLSTNANAGSDVNLCGLTTNLNGNNPSPGTGLWTQVSSSTGGSTIFGNTANSNSSITVSQPGVYTYQWTITNGACTANDQVVITFGAPPIATFTYTSPLCNNSTNPFPTFTGGGVAGTFSSSPLGLNFVNVSTGEINIATTTPGTYTITNTIAASGGCPVVTASFVIVIHTAPNAGTNGTVSVCSNGAAINLFSSLGGTPQATGTWSGPSVLGGGNLGTFTPGTSIAGVYTYTIVGTAPCTNATATVTVTQNTAPNAGTNGTVSVCSNGTAINLFSSLGGTPQATGTWSGPSVLGGGNLGTFTPGTSIAGVYTYTIVGTAPCTNATATVTVTQNTAPNAGSNGTITLCTNDIPTNLFNSLVGTPETSGTWSGPSILAGGNLGTFSPGISIPGVYTYTVTGTIPCLNISSNVLVNVTSSITPSFSFPTTICEGQLAPTLPLTSDNGIIGSWTPATINNVSSANYTFTPAGGCALPVTISVTVEPTVILSPVFHD
ncbi:MAG TPA: Ig-like domain-containing protein [Bacteroidia bacterium]|nr:Ig-like domain-containing protein [Bacteroidia bacterium]